MPSSPVSSPGVYYPVCPGFLEQLPLSVRAEMSLQRDEWVREGVAASPALGMSTHVTSWLCKNWATFGQGGEVLAKAVSLLTDSYLPRGGKTTLRRSICTAFLRTLSRSPSQLSMAFYLLSIHDRKSIELETSEE